MAEGSVAGRKNSTAPARLYASARVAIFGSPSFTLVSAQVTNNYRQWPSSCPMQVTVHGESDPCLNGKRTDQTGLSLGEGAWWAAQDYPEFFAALAPVPDPEKRKRSNA